MKIYDRAKKKEYEEKQYGGGALQFLYQNSFGRLLLKIAVRPFFSRCAALYYDSGFSRKKIEKLIEEYDIDMSLYEKKRYRSFNDFFVRRLKKEELEHRRMRIEANAGHQEDAHFLYSPAQSKLSIVPIDRNTILRVKEGRYSLAQLLEDEQLAEQFQEGLALIFRLSVGDYHRYAFAQSGQIYFQKRIRGVLHTVSSFSSREHVYVKNTREYVVIKHPNFEDMIQMEVGALLVGKIHNHRADYAKKAEEKGYFEFGGSTIVLLFKKNGVKLEEDLLTMADKQMEIRVEYLEKIGSFRRKPCEFDS